MKRDRAEARQGMALGVVMVVMLCASILSATILTLASLNAVEASRYLNSVKAFWLAEAAVQRFDARAYAGQFASVANTTLGSGTYRVEVHPDDSPPYADCIAAVQGDERRIRVQYQYLAIPYENVVHANNRSGTPWVFELRGTNNSAPSNPYRPNTRVWRNDEWHYQDGADKLHGNLFAAGNVTLYQQSLVSNAPAPNTYSLDGDISATGTVRFVNSATNTGHVYERQPVEAVPDLLAMNYASNNTWNIKREFELNADPDGYHLKAGHPLRDVVQKNPSGRHVSTDGGDDYYFEPVHTTNPDTSLNLLNQQVYYVDGHVWFNKSGPLRYIVSGVATIIATHDIHISDNLKYANTNSLLGLIALGKYNEEEQLQTGGNIYFGDPLYGTLNEVNAFMFAANNFLYNTSANDPNTQQEPLTGFQVYGNFAALNQVVIYRDWYGSSSPRAAYYDAGTNRWRDAVSRALLTSSQTNSLRHYQMTVKYDERIRNQATQPPRLPRQQGGAGANGIYGGIVKWDLAPFD